MIRDGLSKALDNVPDMEVVGHADDGLTAIRITGKILPDVAVMDIGMPGLNGIDATRQIHKESPTVKIIALSMYSSGHYIKEMFRAGASGYILKNCQFDELVEAIRTVTADKTFISPSISDLIIESYITKGEEEVESAFTLLSQREREVTQLLTEGKTTKQAARYLCISPKTVEVHRSRILNKLHIDNIVQLTKYAIKEGLTASEPWSSMVDAETQS